MKSSTQNIGKQHYKPTAASVRQSLPSPSPQMDFNQGNNDCRRTFSSRRIFVGGLSLETNSSHLATYFSRFGTIANIRIIGEKKNRSRGYGFVTFDDSSSLNKVFSSSSKHVINGNSVDCNEASEFKNSAPKVYNPLSKIHVSGISPKTKKSQLRKVFARFGKIAEILIIFRKHKNRAFAFIQFTKPIDALQAIQTRNTLRNGRVLLCELAKPKPSIEPKNVSFTKVLKKPHSQKVEANRFNSIPNTQHSNPLIAFQANQPSSTCVSLQSNFHL